MLRNEYEKDVCADRRGKVLDRINKINRILGNGSDILNLVNPVNPV